jgi:O-antigen/teichoic acid export membrane protein
MIVPDVDSQPSLGHAEPIGPGGGWRRTLKQRTGIDRAIGFVVLGRLVQGVGSIGTVLLIVRILTPVEQGFYYALWSLTALQTLFELGFSFVVLQSAAHEMAHLTTGKDGLVQGNARAQNRLASLLQLSVRWYLIAAVVMALLLIFGGTPFFAMKHQDVSESLWKWPLRAAAISCAASFAVIPVVSFLEGCGQVTEMARMRFVQSLCMTIFSWGAVLSHHELYAPALVLSSHALVALIMIYRRRAFLLYLLRFRGPHIISWRQELWPFQWKIAVSWICDYFIFYFFTPILFAFRGPVEAGRMGVSMSAVLQLSALVLAWMSTKATPFGTLAAQKDTPGLDRLFFKTLRQSLALLACGSAALLGIVLFLPHVFPKISQRIVSWPVFAVLLLTAMSTHIVQSEALYLRAHKIEPFLVQSIAIASATLGLMFLVVKPWGTLGVSLVYFFVLGICGLISATLIFRSYRRRWNRNAGPLQSNA